MISSASSNAAPGNDDAPIASVSRVALFLFCSGACALVMQIAWMREMRLAFGASTAASAAVLAIFMGGLGLGNALLGPLADRRANPLRLYGQLELAVAIGSALTPALVAATGALYVLLGGQERLGAWGATFARLAFATVVLAAPTFLMGGTLPAAVRAAAAESDRRRRSLGVLYGANTIGAVAGALIATFVLLELLGTSATLWAACAVNALVGFAAVSRSRRAAPVSRSEKKDRRRRAVESDSPRESPSDQDQDADASPAPPVFGYAAAAVAGFVFFLMELVWGRMLAPLLGGTTFTFGLILAVALLGIGVGGALYPLFFRFARPSWGWFSLLCGLEAIFLAAPLAAGDWLALWAGWLSSDIAYKTSGSALAATGGWALVTAVVALPTAIVSGVQFPLLIALIGRGRQAIGRQLGIAYGFNTLGAIAGSLAGGFGLLPLLTAPGAWRFAIGLLVLLGVATGALAIARRTPLQNARAGKAIAASAIALFALAAWMATATGPTAAWRHSGIGAGRANLPAGTIKASTKWMRDVRAKTVSQREGVETAVAIGVSDGMSFIVNGKSDGNATADAATQIGLGLVGAVLHPSPRRALVIGLGTGETAGWLAAAPSIEEVQVAELEPAIEEMARRSARLNRDVLSNPKVRLVYNDGREMLLCTPSKFDLIVSEPSNPYRAGVAALFTKEFYEAAAAKLQPGGLFLQWLQGYEVELESVAVVLATLHEVFGHVEIWETKSADMLLVCSVAPIERRLADVRGKLEIPELRRGLNSAWRCDDLEGFLARYVGGPKFAKRFADLASGERNTDDRTVLEFGFARSVGKATGFRIQALRNEAARDNDARPRFVDYDPGDYDPGDYGPGDRVAGEAEIDWAAVDEESLLINAFAFADPALAAGLSENDRKRVEARIKYLSGDYQAPAKAGVEFLRPEGLSMLAHSWAEAGDERAFESLDAVQSLSPAEAAGVLAILRHKLGRTPEAIAGLSKALLLMKEDPWIQSPVAYRILEVTMELGDQNRQAAETLYPSIEAPFAAYRMEAVRRVTAYMLARKLEPALTAEALAVFEPHAPWQEELLEVRERVYRETNHKLAPLAARELQRFRSQ